jgi:hypothetical protein
MPSSERGANLTRDEALAGARGALLAHLPKDAILARYAGAAGKEVTSGKFASPESSAALAANAFGFFLEDPSAFTLPGLSPFGETISVELEAQMRFPWRGGLHPWLDAAARTETHLNGIESKRYEPFRDAKKAAFSKAYDRPVWGENMSAYEAVRDALRDGGPFRFLDAAQLVKHAFGLRTQAVREGRRPVLVYLFAEPRAFPSGREIADADLKAHRAEIAAFVDLVAPSEVLFIGLSYRELVSYWVELPKLRTHACALVNSFDL